MKLSEAGGVTSGHREVAAKGQARLGDHKVPVLWSCPLGRTDLWAWVAVARRPGSWAGVGASVRAYARVRVRELGVCFAFHLCAYGRVLLCVRVRLPFACGSVCSLCPRLLYLLVSIRLSLSSYGCLFMQRLECLWFALAIPADDFTAGLRWQPEDRLGYAICFKHLMITY